MNIIFDLDSTLFQTRISLNAPILFNLLNETGYKNFKTNEYENYTTQYTGFIG